MVITVYKDDRGWAYKVMPDLAGNYRARYNKPGTNRWKSCLNFKPKANCYEAADDLKAWAEQKGFKIFCRYEEE